MTSESKELKISVCMATRNGGRYIGEQVASILPQLGPDDEVIVSDDSSTDETVRIVKDLNDPRIRLLEGNTFYSPIFNFENALKRTTGEIIILSDQDDVWLEGRVERILSRFRHASSAIHLLIQNGYVVDDAGGVIEESLFRKINAGKGLLKNIYDNTYMGCCMAFSRPLLEIALPFPRRIPMHDMWLGILAELFGTVEFDAERTIWYRKHAASTTDFPRRFIPVTQIKRRLFLSWALGTRFVARKYRMRTMKSELTNETRSTRS